MQSTQIVLLGEQAMNSRHMATTTEATVLTQVQTKVTS